MNEMDGFLAQPLARRRDFGDYMSDSWHFLWRNKGAFFGKYILLGLVPVLLLAGLAMSYTMRVDPARMSMFADVYTAEGLSALFGPMIGLLGGMVLVSIVVGLYTQLYPIVYLKIVNEHGHERIGLAELGGGLLRALGKGILFLLVGLVTFLPIGVVYTLICLPLFLLFLLGLPLLILGLCFIGLWFTISFYVYLHEDINPFGAIGRGWKTIFGQFWPRIGAYIVGTLISTVAGMVCSGLVAGVAVVVILCMGGKLFSAYVIFQGMNILMSFAAYAFVQVMVGMIYFSGKYERIAPFEAHNTTDAI